MMRRSLVMSVLLALGCGVEPVCESCEFDIEEAVTLEDVGYTMSSRVSRTSDGGFVVIGTYDPERSCSSIAPAFTCWLPTSPG